MLRLLKYEFLKARTNLLILLSVTAAVEALFLIGVWTKDIPAVTLTLILLFFLAIAGTAWVGLECVLTLHRDIRSRQSYMLFMTDRSCFGILGAKLIQTGVCVTVVTGIFVGLGYLDGDVFFGTFNQKALDYWQTGNILLSKYAGADLRDGTLMTMGLVTYSFTWLSYISAACFADVLAHVWLPGKRLPLIVAFLIFSAMAYVINWTQTLLPAYEIYQHSLMLATGLSLVYVGVLYTATAFLMERRLSV